MFRFLSESFRFRNGIGNIEKSCSYDTNNSLKSLVEIRSLHVVGWFIIQKIGRAELHTSQKRISNVVLLAACRRIWIMYRVINCHLAISVVLCDKYIPNENNFFWKRNRNCCKTKNQLIQLLVQIMRSALSYHRRSFCSSLKLGLRFQFASNIAVLGGMTRSLVLFFSCGTQQKSHPPFTGWCSAGS